MPPRRKKRHVVRDPVQLDAVVSPLRHRLLKSLASMGPCSVKDLAQDLETSAESLYYHVKALVEVGLILEHGMRTSNGRNEMLYGAIADRLQSDPNETSPEYLKAYRRAVSALLRLSEREVTGALERQEEAGTRRPVSLTVRHVQVRLSLEAQKEVKRRTEALFDFIMRHDDADQKTRVSVLLVSSPLKDGRRG